MKERKKEGKKEKKRKKEKRKQGQVGQLGASCGRVDRQTNALPDQPTDKASY